MTEKLSIIIPAYNEEKRILNTILTANSYLKKKSFEYEILVINDGSNDRTEKVVFNLMDEINNLRLVGYSVNKGKGFAVKKGFIESKGDIVLFMDADGATPIDEIDKFLELIQEYDIVIGSRAIPKNDVVLKTSIHRKFIGRTFNFFVKNILKFSYFDTQCGFKMFNKEKTLEIFKNLKIYGFAFDLEILFLGEKSNLKIKEVAVNWENQAGSKVNLVLDSLRMFRDIIRIRIR